MGRGPEAQGTLRQKRIAKKRSGDAQRLRSFLSVGEGYQQLTRGTGSFAYQNRSARVKGYKKETRQSRVSSGSGRRIRTLTYGVRVRCATFTQSRYVLTNKNYYTDFTAFVKSFFYIPRKKAAQGSDRGERAEPCAEREVFYLPCACTRSAPVRYLPSGL